MKSFLLFLFFIPTILFAEEYWQQHVHYTIDVRLDTKEHKIHGQETLIYKNNSPDKLTFVYIRLYWNLFTEGSRGDKMLQNQKNYYLDRTGGVSVEKLSIVDNGSEATPQYNIDNTMMKVELPSPLMPGESLTLNCSWIGNIPEGGDRTGHDGRDYDIAQWYPQIATYDKFGWDVSQYLSPAEFHNEYGEFDVNVTLPKSFTMGFSGWLLNPEEVYADSIREKLKNSEGKSETVNIANFTDADYKDGEDTALVTWKFRAENVRDFAWSANEHYIWDVSHYDPNDGAQPVTINALYFEDKAEYWKNTAEYGRHAITFFSEHFGRYAYPNCFAVEGPVGGGMEYPGITFIGHYGDKTTHSPFGVVVHEIGHNWYPMMMGSNETHYGFMDEGFNTFITALATEAYYGRYDNSYVWTEWYQKLLSYSNDDTRSGIQQGTIGHAKNGFEEPIATHIYRYDEPAIFGSSIYTKTGAVMYMLQYVLGDSVFEHCMKEYYNRWKFKHPYPEDFYQTMSEASGRRNLQWFFDQWFHRTWTCDYGICGLDYEKKQKDNRIAYQTKFHIYRVGQSIMPLDVQIEMANGEKQTIFIPVEEWMNAETEFDTTIELNEKPVRAEINPDGRIVDMNRLNNRTGLPKTKIEFDNTLFAVQPIDAYFIKIRPSFWYTDEGGWNLGYKLSGSYLGDEYRTSISQLYNIREKKLNNDLLFGHNLYRLSRQMSYEARWFNLEGRKGATISLNKGFTRHISYPPNQGINLTYSYSELTNGDYLLHPSTWTQGVLNRFILGYDYYNRWKDWNMSANAQIEGSSSLFGESDFQYSKRTFEIKANISLPSSSVNLRFYNGIGYGTIPNQVKYYYASGSPMDQFGAPFFRSKGMLPSTVRDHALYQGGGNMRGYYRYMAAGDKIDAMNFEWRFNSFLPWSSIRIPYVSSITRYFKTSLFFDAGRITNQSNNLWDERFEMDCGVSLRLTSLYSLLGVAGNSNIFSGLGLRTIRIDFPFFVSYPYPGENKFKFRWAISLNEAF